MISSHAKRSVMGCLICLAGAVYSTCWAEPPSNEVIQAALASQSAASIECSYTIDSVPSKGQQIGPLTYVRTPELIYRKMGSSERVSPRSDVTRIVECRLKETASDGTVLGSVIRDRPLLPWSGYDRLDTAMYPLMPRADDESTCFLYGWIKYATVSPNTESIDERPCWKLSVPISATGEEFWYELWLDPAAGFCPRRIVMHRDASEKTTVVSLGEYVEVERGIWFPKRGTVASNFALPGQEPFPPQVFSAISVVAGPQGPAAQSLLAFVAGTRVTTRNKDGSTIVHVAP